MMNTKIIVCAGKMCTKFNGEEIIEALAESFRREADRLEQHVEISLGKCMRSCRKGCVVTTQPNQKKYTKVTHIQVRDIVTMSLEEPIPATN